MTRTNIERCHLPRCEVCAPTRREYAKFAAHYVDALDRATTEDARRDVIRQRRDVLRDIWMKRGPCDE